VTSRWSDDVIAHVAARLVGQFPVEFVSDHQVPRGPTRRGGSGKVITPNIVTPLGCTVRERQARWCRWRLRGRKWWHREPR
jgi:hypothetical protein